jgi:hypothetical protein
MELKSVKTIDLIAELIMRRDPTGSIGGSVFFEFFPWKEALESPVVITVEKNHHNKLLSHYSAMATSDSETSVHEYEYRRPKVYSEFKKVGKQRVHKNEFVETDNRQDSLWDYWSSEPVVG